MTSMRAELAPRLKTLQREGISAVDLDQAMIGPGMSVFSSYGRVMEADGSPMSVRKALALINRVIDELRTEEEGDLDPESRFAAAWFSQFGFQEGEFGRADDLARAKNVAVQGVVDAGIAASRPGFFRLLSPQELDVVWDPLVDTRLTVWEVAHQILARLDAGGDRAAADVTRKVGGLADAALALAYRLYAVSEQKGWAQVAGRYDSLVVAWPEIRRLADETPVARPEQTRLKS
jgi:putative DNA methylase